MILSNKAIGRAIRQRKIVLDPKPEKEQFAPSALDLRVGNQFFKWKETQAGSGAEVCFDLSAFNITLCKDHLSEVRPESDGRIKLKAGDFILANTLEKITLEYTSQLAARVEGRSGFARLGLQVHMTAPTIHCGFIGNIILELKNCGNYPLLITPNKTYICQLIFETVKDKPVGSFNSKFQYQTGPIGRH